MYKKNILKHMVIWGGTSGILLGMFYAALWMAFGDFGDMSSLTHIGSMMVAVPFSMVYGALFGGTVGLFLGFLNGLMMAAVRYDDSLSHNQQQKVCYAINLLVITLAVLFLSDGGAYVSWFLVGAPSIIAAGASLLATERYFVHLKREPARKRQHV
jgi:hypothetical protein